MLDMSGGPGWGYATGPTIDDMPVGAGPNAPTRGQVYDRGMGQIAAAYQVLIEAGADVQDARGILPTNILTNICMKINMRNFIDLAKKRSSARVQDEYRSVVEGMKAEVLRVHPWTEVFMNRTADVAAMELQEMITQSMTVSNEMKINMIKKLDQIRKDM